MPNGHKNITKLVIAQLINAYVRHSALRMDDAFFNTTEQRLFTICATTFCFDKF